MFPDIPKFLHNTLEKYWENFVAACKQKNVTLSDLANFKIDAFKVWAVSDFAAQQCIRFPKYITNLLESGKIEKNYMLLDYEKTLSQQLINTPSFDMLCHQLRIFRYKQLLRIAWRDLLGISDFNNTSIELSALADACIKETLALLYKWQCEKDGIPINKNHMQQSLLVIAVGKLGGNELNFSSDIDLIFAYPSAGHASTEKHTITNHQFFTALAQHFIKAFSNITKDGFVFRVDMRLRPYGRSGPLVMNIKALRNYYYEHGRNWERYALIKARIIAGDSDSANKLINIIRNFIYRPFLDFGAIETLREMKSLFHQDVIKNKLENDIKQGPGGIREIEFIAQTQQLIHGGRHIHLQTNNLLSTLSRLEEFNLLESSISKRLKEIYVLFRNIENRIQMLADQQRHILPKEDITRARLAYAMGYKQWESMEVLITRFRDFVLQLFLERTAEPIFRLDSSTKSMNIADLHALWIGRLSKQLALRLLTQLNFKVANESLRLINNLRDKARKHLVSKNTIKRIRQIGPQILFEIAKTNEPDTTIRRLVGLLETLMRSSSYLALLLENPKALKQLIKLSASSPWITAQITSMPELIDELRDSRSLYAPHNTDELKKELKMYLKQIPPENLEQQISCLRYFKQAQVLRVAAADITGKLPLMKVSDHLTFTACVIIDEVHQIAWNHMIRRYGKPSIDLFNQNNTGFSIIGYGKLGGIELGYSSDLDLVFIYDDSKPFETRSKTSISFTEFYRRMAQLILQVLSQQTSAGVLYKTDTRLRPSGNSGLLVNGISSFQRYQTTQAWTWEHQALVRARAISSAPSLGKRFTAIRHEILSKKRTVSTLQKDIIDMRNRMQQAAKKVSSNQFDLKFGEGGIADIEFIVQFGTLRWAHEHPALLAYPDNIRILEQFAEEELMPKETVANLCKIYCIYRERGHRLALQRQPKIVSHDEFIEHREFVKSLWGSLLVNHVI